MDSEIKIRLLQAFVAIQKATIECTVPVAESKTFTMEYDGYEWSRSTEINVLTVYKICAPEDDTEQGLYKKRLEDSSWQKAGWKEATRAILIAQEFILKCNGEEKRMIELDSIIHELITPRNSLSRF